MKIFFSYVYDKTMACAFSRNKRFSMLLAGYIACCFIVSCSRNIPQGAPPSKNAQKNSGTGKKVSSHYDSTSAYDYYSMDSYTDITDSLTQNFVLDEQDATALRSFSTAQSILKTAYANRLFNAQAWLKSDRGFSMRLNPNRISAYDPIIKKMARRYGFDWRLIAAQIYTESNFTSDVKSGAGALGLMQVMPSTARIIGVPPEKMCLPHINIAVGCLYNQRMYYLWKRETNKTDQRLAFAFASYNAGRGRVLRSYDTRKNLTTWETVHRGLPEETQKYVHKIFLKYDVYRKNILP